MKNKIKLFTFLVFFLIIINTVYSKTEETKFVDLPISGGTIQTLISNYNNLQVPQGTEGTNSQSTSQVGYSDLTRRSADPSVPLQSLYDMASGYQQIVDYRNQVDIVRKYVTLKPEVGLVVAPTAPSKKPTTKATPKATTSQQSEQSCTATINKFDSSYISADCNVIPASSITDISQLPDTNYIYYDSSKNNAYPVVLSLQIGNIDQVLKVFKKEEEIRLDTTNKFTITPSLMEVSLIAKPAESSFDLTITKYTPTSNSALTSNNIAGTATESENIVIQGPSFNRIVKFYNGKWYWCTSKTSNDNECDGTFGTGEISGGFISVERLNREEGTAENQETTLAYSTQSAYNSFFSTLTYKSNLKDGLKQLLISLATYKSPGVLDGFAVGNFKVNYNKNIQSQTDMLEISGITYQGDLFERNNNNVPINLKGTTAQKALDAFYNLATKKSSSQNSKYIDLNDNYVVFFLNNEWRYCKYPSILTSWYKKASGEPCAEQSQPMKSLNEFSLNLDSNEKLLFTTLKSKPNDLDTGLYNILLFLFKERTYGEILGSNYGNKNYKIITIPKTVDWSIEQRSDYSYVTGPQNSLLITERGISLYHAEETYSNAVKFSVSYDDGTTKNLDSIIQDSSINKIEVIPIRKGFTSALNRFGFIVTDSAYNTKITIRDASTSITSASQSTTSKNIEIEGPNSNWIVKYNEGMWKVCSDMICNSQDFVSVNNLFSQQISFGDPDAELFYRHFIKGLENSDFKKGLGILVTSLKNCEDISSTSDLTTSVFCTGIALNINDYIVNVYNNNVVINTKTGESINYENIFEGSASITSSENPVIDCIYNIATGKSETNCQGGIKSQYNTAAKASSALSKK